jgi:hypothetical protein
MVSSVQYLALGMPLKVPGNARQDSPVAAR